MPTDTIKKVGATNSPTTMDYSTVQSWEDACPANLVTADQRWIGECYDQGEFATAGAPLVISGTTVDSTRYLILRCATGASFKDKSGVRTTALTYNASNGVAIRCTAGYIQAIDVQVDYTQLIGLQVKTTLTGADATIRDTANAAINGLIDSCLVYSKCFTGIWWSGKVTNSLIIVDNSFGRGIRVEMSNGAFYGCTVVGIASDSGQGIYSSTAGSIAPTIKNCAIFGFASASSAGNTFTGSYNATDQSSVGFGTNNQTSLTYASQFVSSSNDFRAVNTGSLKNGTPDTTNIPNDITGTARDATTPYIGCWEVVSAGGRIFRTSSLEGLGGVGQKCFNPSLTGV